MRRVPPLSCRCVAAGVAAIVSLLAAPTSTWGQTVTQPAPSAHPIDLSAVVRLAEGQQPAPSTGGRVGAPLSGGLVLDIPDHGPVVVVVENVELTPLGSRLVTGHVKGERLSSVVFAVRDGALSGSVDHSGGSFQFSSVEGGWGVGATPPADLDDCEVPQEPSITSLQSAPQSDTAAGARTSAALQVAEPVAAGTMNDPHVIDLLVVYTPKARHNAGSTAGMLAHLEAATVALNAALTRSLVPVVVRLVAAEEFAYVESGDSGKDLTAMGTPGTALNMFAQQMRSARQADLVMLVIGFRSTGRTGLAASVPVPVSAPWNATGFTSMVLLEGQSFPVRTWIHEIGHNFGLNHHYSNSLFPLYPGDPVEPVMPLYSAGGAILGYGPIGEPFSSIMYETCADCIRLPLFSNPRLIERGISMGDAEKTDSARAIAENAPFIADYSRNCSYQVSPALPPEDGFLAVPGQGASLAYTISTDPTCLTSVRTREVPWLRTSLPLHHRGAASVTITVDRNDSDRARGTRLAIGDRVISLFQELPCTPDPTRLTTSQMTVSAMIVPGIAENWVQLPVEGVPAGGPRCPLKVESDQSWLKPVNNSTAVVVAPNFAPVARTATVTVNGQKLAVTQAPGVCAFHPGAGAVLTASNGFSSVGMIPDSRCSWQVSSATPWISFPQGTARTGPGSVSFAATTNTTGAVRQGEILVEGTAFPVFQLPQGATPCQYSYSLPSGTIPPAGGSVQLTITTTPSCPWALSSAQQATTFSAITGLGPAVVTVSLPRNETGLSRFASIGTVYGTAEAVVPVNGAPALFLQQLPVSSPTFTLSATTSSFGQQGGAGVLNIGATPGSGWRLSVTAGKVRRKHRSLAEDHVGSLRIRSDAGKVRGRAQCCCGTRGKPHGLRSQQPTHIVGHLTGRKCSCSARLPTGHGSHTHDRERGRRCLHPRPSGSRRLRREHPVWQRCGLAGASCSHGRQQPSPTLARASAQRRQAAQDDAEDQRHRCR